MPPELLLMTGDWPEYLDLIYERFLDDLVRNTLYFEGLKISCPYRPESHGKHFSFWHLISEGSIEEDRLPDPRRCERIGWIAWTIDCANAGRDVVHWRNTRGSSTHVVLLHTQAKYAVILAERRDYFVLKAAYPTPPRRFESLMAEYEEKKHSP